MEKERLSDIVRDLFEGLENNDVYLPGEDVTVPVLEMPLYGIASADDPVWEGYRDPEAIGSGFMAPKEWMEDAQSVIVFFFPFTEEIRSRARTCTEPVSEAWSLGYGKRDEIIRPFLEKLMNRLKEYGIKCLDPLQDPRQKLVKHDVDHDGIGDIHYCVSWSSRHAGYAAGLGTFGIHRHLITEKGCCGTMGNLIVNERFEPDGRKYDDIYGACIRCGACVKRCPSGAITVGYLRNLRICSEYAGEVRKEYGGFCGKCLVGIPCEDEDPAAE